MTLSERLNDYKTRNRLSINRLIQVTGISRIAIISMLKETRPPNGTTIKKLVYQLGPEFEEYLEYKTCHCGAKFISRRYGQKCCSKKCREATIRKNPRPELEKQKEIDQVVKFRESEISFAEYNERARAQGLSYGQLQGLERLGLR